MIKVITWNVNSIKARLPIVVDWVKENNPDVLLLQETKTEDKNFPAMEFEDLGYNVAVVGQKSYNGVAILAKRPIEDIFDLPKEKSFIKWAVDQGHTVFIISWVNPNSKHSNKNFPDYIQEGPLAALDAIKKITGEQQVNAIGHCLGGTLLSCILGYLGPSAAKFFKSTTILTSLFDFSKAGELMLFTDNEHLALLSATLDKLGYLDGKTMNATFNMLRANDLIWSSFINNYLLDNEPPQFDFLFWNADSTNLPATMYRFYMEKMFQKNLLIKPGGLSFFGKPVDLRKNSIPSFILGAIDDHISPWKSVYPATQLFSGINKFVLAGSGHVAGVINPPAGNKYNYWTNDNFPDNPDEWLENANEHKGSWWNDWASWVSEYGGEKIAAKSRKPGKGALPAIEDAPGSYVQVRTE